MDDDHIHNTLGTEANPQTRRRRGLLNTLKAGSQGALAAGLMIVWLPVVLAWTGGGTAGAVVAGMERDWGSLALSLVIPGYGEYYTIDTLLFSSGPSAMDDQVAKFVSLANAGPTRDQDCIAHGGEPETDILGLQKMESTTIVVDGKEFPVLTKATSVYVPYAWPTPDPPHVAIGVCRFSDE